MKNKLGLLFILFLTITFENIKAQYVGVSMIIPPSGQSMSLGMTGVAYEVEGGLGHSLNPAVLGFKSQVNFIETEGILGEQPYLGFSNVTREYYSVSLGYNFHNLLNGVNLSAGAGYISSRLNYSDMSREISSMCFGDGYLLERAMYFYGPFEMSEKISSVSFGAGIEYYLLFAAGISFKNVNQKDAWYEPESVNLNAIDYGFMIKAPITKLINDKYRIYLRKTDYLAPSADITIGYANDNEGTEIIRNSFYKMAAFTYDKRGVAPLPGIARLGYSLDLGLKLVSEKFVTKLFDYTFIAEAHDRLSEYHSEESNIYAISYKGMLGNINFGKNLIQLKVSDGVTIHKGHKLSFFETLDLYFGSLNGGGYNGQTTRGFAIRSQGILKTLTFFTDSETFNFIADHFDVRYTQANIFDNYFVSGKAESFNISFSNFSF